MVHRQPVFMNSTFATPLLAYLAYFSRDPATCGISGHWPSWRRTRVLLVISKYLEWITDCDFGIYHIFAILPSVGHLCGAISTAEAPFGLGLVLVAFEVSGSSTSLRYDSCLTDSRPSPQQSQSSTATSSCNPYAGLPLPLALPCGQAEA